ncbi:NIP1 [[Candida] subhashii]|uniref:Eukaryotic translation initiation factor 3 subunit C n=1 Tax=[Candida] subhashii TaxID=561895 RepID=A0A8J5R496_9ASCO|nr:NIP1 [[Candida] subhashii]KAG7665215.1 NIP1 [[Candida] subhashii]
MSRFFVTGYTSDSSSEEEDLLSTSEEELLSSSDEEELEESSDLEFQDESDEESSSDEEGRPSGPAYFLKKSFLKGAGGESDESESDDEGKKVVKSAKDKLLDDMKESVEVINVNKRSNNWTLVLTEFDKLGRYLIRANQQNIGTPNFFITLLASLEDYVNATAENEKADKTMNAAEARAFNTTRQRVRKQIKEFQFHYDLYREKPELFEQDDEPLKAEPAHEVNRTGEEGAEGGFQGVRHLSPVFATLKQILESRGKKNVDKYEQIQILEELLEQHLGDGVFELINIYQTLLSVRFDASSNQTFMPVEMWQKNQRDLNSLLNLLETNINTYQVSELGEVTDDIDIEPTPNTQGVKVMFGSIISSIDRLDDELTKCLQSTDPHSTDYIERLKDEHIVYKLVVRGQSYSESITPEDVRLDSEQLARIVLRRLEHIYYKPDQLIKSIEEEAWKDIAKDSTIITKNSTPSELIDGLSGFLQEHDNVAYGEHAILFSIYYYAVNNNYAKARDLFLDAQFYNNINNADSTLQVQYNRALVQLGLSAFRSGSIEESHKILNEVVNSQRAKELLGQGFSTKYPSQATTVEKQKLLPFHQHINLELLECVHSTCSLLIEIPALAAASHSAKDSSKRKANIKSFKSKLEFHERQFFTGPPESIKDHIVHASIALHKGNWAKAYNLLSSIKIWKLFPDNDDLLKMMKNQLQIEGLRTYIFTFKSVYSKLSISRLSKIFELSPEAITEVLDKMIESNDINGSFDESKQFINFTPTDLTPQRSRLQELAIVMKEKINVLSEKNEKTSSNGYGKRQSPQQQQQQQEQQQEQQQQRDLIQEEHNKFRYANVNANNDEFQATV